MKEVLLSIIIPVYNKEKYLGRCLESISKQNSNEVEIIIVDDGSTDDSKKIANNFCKINSNYFLIEQSNNGVSSARNNGLKHINGKYVTFVDSDDDVTSTYISDILNVLKNEDVELLCFDLNKVVNGSYRIMLHLRNDDLTLNPTEGFIKFLDRSIYNVIEGYVCSKVFKTEVIKRNDINFDVRKRIGEDIVFCSEYCFHITMIRLFGKALYNY